MNSLFSAFRFFRLNRLYEFSNSCFSSTKMSTLETLNFDNLALKKLPIDDEKRNYIRTVRGACFSLVKPTPVENPRVVALSYPALGNLDLPETEVNRPDFVEYFSGNKLLPGSETAAHCYCGHQFGSFAGQLGDGAAMYLGEVVNSEKERWEIQLKGAGLTPYSRSADGQKVLRSSIREFLCSEVMHYLGIPTTRAGACITSDSEVIRDIFYDGNAKPEKCTIVLRMAQTFIRFGSFEIFNTMDPYTGRVGPSVGRTDILKTLLHYVIETFYPEIYQNHRDEEQEMYKAFFKEVVRRTAVLVAEWQCVGFCHGVLNTDNMSIVGLTLDYGPFGFLDMYNPDHICNGSDERGRYTYQNQPKICKYNLFKLSEAIQKVLPLSDSEPLCEMFDGFYFEHYVNKMLKKLGLLSPDIFGDGSLLQDLLDTMQATSIDFTHTFLCLHLIDAGDLDTTIPTAKEKLLGCLYPIEVQVKAARPNINPVQLEMFKKIANSGNLEQFGEAAKAIKDILSKHEKAEALASCTPKDKAEKDDQLWTEWLNKYKTRIVKDMEMYKGDPLKYNEERLRVMKENNPRFILRNYICQNAIEKAENGDFSEVQRVLELLKTPYDQSNAETTDSNSKDVKSCSEEYGNLCNPPEWAFDLKVT